MKSKLASAVVEVLVGVVLVGAILGGLAPRVDDTDIAAKVAQARNDMKAICVALEAYHTDHSRYPFDSTYYWLFAGHAQGSFDSPLSALTTPVAYMDALPSEQFPSSGTLASNQYRYSSQHWLEVVTGLYWLPRNIIIGPDIELDSTDKWALVSNGPDQISNEGQYFIFGEEVLNRVTAWEDGSTIINGPGCLYDATNGTLSAGDLVHLSTPRTASVKKWEQYK